MPLFRAGNSTEKGGPEPYKLAMIIIILLMVLGVGTTSVLALYYFNNEVNFYVAISLSTDSKEVDAEESVNLTIFVQNDYDTAFPFEPYNFGIYMVNYSDSQESWFVMSRGVNQKNIDVLNEWKIPRTTEDRITIEWSFKNMKEDYYYVVFQLREVTKVDEDGEWVEADIMDKAKVLIKVGDPQEKVDEDWTNRFPI